MHEKNVITSTNIFGRNIKYLQQVDVVMQLEISLTETLLTKIYYVLLFWNKTKP
jgi:hypothetical protein